MHKPLLLRTFMFRNDDKNTYMGSPDAHSRGRLRALHHRAEGMYGDKPRIAVTEYAPRKDNACDTLLRSMTLCWSGLQPLLLLGEE